MDALLMQIRNQYGSRSLAQPFKVWNAAYVKMLPLERKYNVFDISSTHSDFFQLQYLLSFVAKMCLNYSKRQDLMG